MTHTSLPAVADGLQQYITQINRFEVLSREAEHELAVRYHETEDRDAAQRLVLANLRFVVKIAYEYQSYGFRMADLIQEGNLGLMMAVKKFDPHKGFKLISYAVWWIRAYIQNFILRSWSLVKIGTTQAQRKLFYKLRQSKRKLLGSVEKDFEQALQSEEAHVLAERMALKEDDVLEMDARLMSRDFSLNAPLSDDAHTTHQDLLCAPTNQEDMVAAREESEQQQGQVRQALKALNPREHYIILHRLMADEPMTLQEIGDHFGISRERARQLEARAKQKLRVSLEAA